ncbi:hypothetical protein P3T76_006073 [Phytophthora citrophthora]|uniref:Uncharacterized protein n=1 Tax=Phytophthora citrophthora TaxID=4793 RepID=A0AAD9GQ71_9STRA|nr:hypothetical protein P3T76_006073 [Phytophthora citrophthora]
MDQNLHTKECGVEIPVLLEPFVELLCPKGLDKLSRLHNAVKTIRREWEEESLSFVAAGTFRCTFVLSVTNADLSRYYPIDLDMVKKMEELVDFPTFGL